MADGFRALAPGGLSLSLLAVGLLLPVAMPDEPLADEQGEEGEEIAYNLDLEPVALDAVEPAQGARERVAAACGRSARELAGIVVFAGLVRSQAGEQEVRMVRVPFRLGETTFAALLALHEHGGFATAAIVDDVGTPVPEWQKLLGNLRHYELPKLDGARPRSHLREVRATAEGSQDPEARLTLALLDVLGHMNEQASVFNIPAEMQTLAPDEACAMMSEQYAAVLELADDLTPLLGESTAEFRRLARESSESASAMAEATRAGDQAAGEEAQTRVMANCNACHRMPLDDGRPLSEVFTEARSKRGIGDGYWQVGHDVRIHHADRPKLQRVVDALREAALLIDATR